jgi:uncharacterized membrane protein
LGEHPSTVYNIGAIGIENINNAKTLSIKEFKLDNQIVEIYNKLNKDYIIDRDLLNEYVIMLNALLIKGIIKTLLENNQDIIEGIYSNDSQQ